MFLAFFSSYERDVSYYVMRCMRLKANDMQSGLSNFFRPKRIFEMHSWQGSSPPSARHWLNLTFETQRGHLGVRQESCSLVGIIFLHLAPASKQYAITLTNQIKISDVADVLRPCVLLARCQPHTISSIRSPESLAGRAPVVVRLIHSSRHACSYAGE